ncbi:MAG: hypothetical protein EBU01_15555, partial [Crocinitomicaceae bacterium]|nr:hypothetical protein [Crocinitomicaceae bacterium]
MALIEKKEKQSILDVVLENSGAISSLFEFMEVNNLTSLEIPSGKYIATQELNPSIVQFFKTLRLKSNVFPITSETPPYIPPTTGGGSVHVYNSDGSFDETVTAPDNLPLNDITITLVNSDDETITTETLAAAVDGSVTAPDGTVVIKKSDGTIIVTQAVKSNALVNATIADSTVVLKRSNATTIASQSVMAESSVDK